MTVDATLVILADAENPEGRARHWPSPDRKNCQILSDIRINLINYKNSISRWAHLDDLRPVGNVGKLWGDIWGESSTVAGSGLSVFACICFQLHHVSLKQGR